MGRWGQAQGASEGGWPVPLDRVKGPMKMATRQSSSKMSTLASKVLSGTKTPTKTDAKRLAASVLSQDEKKGQRR